MDGTRDPGNGDPNASHPEVGSVAEEAVKLFGAFADLARQHSGDLAGGVGGLGEQAAAFGREINDHLATGSEDCRYCPVCKVVHVVRETSPEVRNHLMVAASSLLQAAAGLLETLPQPQAQTGSAPDAADTRGSAVQRIDLDQNPTDPDKSW